MKGAKFVAVFLCFCLATGVFGDVYLQNPRGGNDRLNEANTNRNNGNRLFDSQNNAKGGYAINAEDVAERPTMKFYESSLLNIQWTAQHGTNIPKSESNVVIQYMCGLASEAPETLIRDGLTTDTIDSGTKVTEKGTNQYRYGMHESPAYYAECNTRSRNQGLFIADRNLGGNTARFTRQNNNGNRNGFECPEERDYYPYWAPSPWVDIAVLTDERFVDRDCKMYKTESQNVKSRFYCLNPNTNKVSKEITEASCTTAGNRWTEQAAFGVAAPECLSLPSSRDNHLGNALGTDEASGYNWTLPAFEDTPCGKANPDAPYIQMVLRIRYNISTADIIGYGDSFTDFTKNAKASPVTNDPDVVVAGANLSLAVDTSQFGRTFQDRSHMFQLMRRPSDVLATTRIYNLNVRGKRGNIVETYPATEYDFVPNTLSLRVGDLIHVQWQGTDKNPQGNAGEGTAGTDRSNMVQIQDLGASYPATDAWLDENPSKALWESAELRSFMAFVGQKINDPTVCHTLAQLQTDNNNNRNQIEQDKDNCFKLNAATPYFDGGLIRMNKTGEFAYMSTRNNNFSNRGQKGLIVVDNLLPAWGIAIVAIGSVAFVGTAGFAGTLMFAKTHPHTAVGQLMSKLTL